MDLRKQQLTEVAERLGETSEDFETQVRHFEMPTIMNVDVFDVFKMFGKWNPSPVSAKLTRIYVLTL